MDLKFFTQNVYMSSPTYHNKLKGDWCTANQEYPYVNMTADIIISENEVEVTNGGIVSNLSITIYNRMWHDPDSGDDKDSFHLTFDLTKEEALYLKKHIEAYLESKIY